MKRKITKTVASLAIGSLLVLGPACGIKTNLNIGATYSFQNFCPRYYETLKRSDKSLSTFRKLESVMDFVERDIIKDGDLNDYRKTYSGMTVDKELGLGINLYKNAKGEEGVYYITLVYADSVFPDNRKDDKMYFTDSHWAAESLEEVVKHFEQSNHEDITDIISYAKSCHIYFTGSLYVGVPFFDNSERKLLIYSIQKDKIDGKKSLTGYGNGEISLEQVTFSKEEE